MEARGECNVSKILKEKGQLNLNLPEIYFKKEVEIKTFSDKRKLRGVPAVAQRNQNLTSIHENSVG